MKPMHVISSGEAAARAVARLRSCLQHGPSGRSLVGLDCEWNRVRKGQKLKGVDLVQVAPSLQIKDSMVFRCSCGVPEPLTTFLEDPKILKVVVGGTDATLLHRSAVRLRGVVDLQRTLRLLGLHETHGTSLAAMYQSLCGKQISKYDQQSNWASNKLSQAQILYAAQDALAALETLQALAGEFVGFREGADVEFATYFVDKFVVDGDGGLTRGSLAQAAAAVLAAHGAPESIRQSVQRAAETRPVCKSNSKGGYYAVSVGRKPGVYESWGDCEKQVVGYSKARYKKFNTKLEADLFVMSR